MVNGLLIARSFCFTLLILLAFTAEALAAQSTAFTYQGKLSDSGNPANGSYDLQFMLFDTPAVGTGTQQGTTQTLTNVTVTGGIFTVQLDFGVCASCFNGAARFLEIAVKPTSGGTFTTLSPRQPITSTPYALKSLAADGLSVVCVSCVTSSQIASVNGSAVTGEIPLASVPAGSTNYIQNQNASTQTADFKVSGDGTAGGTLTGNILSATTQFNIGNDRILANPGFRNLFAGQGAGLGNLGERNTFFGHDAGALNSIGSGNSFFGSEAGISSFSGSNNSIFGSRAGRFNSNGSFNSFFGHRAGDESQGSSNSFFGTGAGFLNFLGNSNTFIGHDAGNTNLTGSFNTAVGENADVLQGDLTNATAIGSKAVVSQNNSLVLGSISGINGATADTNVGVGTTTPAAKLHVSGTGGIRLRVDSDSNGGLALTLNNQPGWSVATVTGGQFQIFNDAIGQNAVWIDPATNNVGLGSITPNDKLDVNGIIRVSTIGTSGTLNLCRNASNQLSACSSSLRYKRNIASLHLGLSLINQLRPVKFDWKKGDEHDLGLIAEEVGKIEPLLVTHNDKGEIEGVKYDRIAVVLINAIKEQQRQIEEQQQQNQEQRRQIEALKKVVCKLSPSEQVCTTSENREQW